MSLVVTQSASSILQNSAVTWTVTVNDAGFKFLRFHMDSDAASGDNPFANQFSFQSATATQKPVAGQGSDRVWYFKIKKGKTYSFTYKARSGVQGAKTIKISEEKIANNGTTTSQTSVQTLTITGDPSQATPAAPSSLVATAISARKIQTTWVDNSNNESFFVIFRSNSSAGPFDEIRTVGSGTTSYIDDNLQGASTYYYKVAARNAGGTSAQTAAASATTSALPALPAAPSALTATAVDQGRIDISFTDNATNEEGNNIYRGTASGGPYVLIDEIGSADTTYTDTGLDANSAYYYVVRSVNEAGESANSNEATATTLPTPQSMGTNSPFFMDPRSRISSVQAGDQLMIFTDYGRPHVLADDGWSLGGMKPQLTAPVLTDGGAASGTGYTGKYTAHIVVCAGELKRSLPGPVSNTLTVAGRKITITPPNDGSRVTVRDQFFDLDGNRIYTGLHWEIYLYESEITTPVRIIQLPITTLAYTTGNNDDITGLDAQVKRPIETARESQIGPCCAFGELYGDRVHCWGELTFKPSDTETQNGAVLKLTNDSRVATLQGVDWNEALWQKEVLVGGKSSGWFVGDIDGDTLHLFAASEEKHNAGWQFNTTSLETPYFNFSFAPVSNRMSRSAKFAGEAGGNMTIYFQSFPPLNDIGAELSPDDNQDPVAAKSARGVLFVLKRSKCFFVEGGFGLDEAEDGSDKPSVQLIADNTGVISPYSVVVDGDGNLIFLSDAGPTMLSRGGVKRLGLSNGTAFILKNFFDVSSAQNSVAQWFPREGYYVLTNINKIGNTSFKDGLIWESRTNRIVTFSTARRYKSLLPCLHNDGDFQLLTGDESGNVGTFLQKGIYTDNVDYQSTDPFADEVEFDFDVTTGVYSSGGNLSVGRFKRSVKQKPLSTPIALRVSIDAEPQSGDSSDFTETVGATYMSDDSRPVYRIDKLRTQSMRIRLSGQSSRLELLQFRELAIEVNNTKSGQDQDE